MVDFRKSFLLLAVLLLVSSMAYGANVAFSCTATAGNVPVIRAEGLAEYVGDVVLNCTGGDPTDFGNQVPVVNFRIFLNTNVTSALTASNNWSESILAIDDPAPNDVSPLRGPQTPDNAGAFLRGIGSGVNGAGIDYKNPGNFLNQTGAGGINHNTEVYNVFQGQVVAANQIEWRGVPVDPPGTNNRIVRITNVRANAAAFGVSGTLVPAQLTMFISATGTGQFPINQPTQVVATILDGMTFDVLGATSYLQCVSEAEADGLCDYDVLLRYKENFPTAFKWIGPVEDADIFGESGKFQTSESNYRNSAIDGVFGSYSGLATQGTRLLARFKNVPSGVNIRIWQMQKNIACDSDDAKTGDDNRVSTAWADYVPDANSNGYTGDPDGDDSWTDDPVDYATWEILETEGQDQVLDTMYFAVDIAYTSDTTAGIPALGTASVAGTYAPLSTAGTAQRWNSSSHGHPRFIDDSEDQDLASINSCSTSLLWPYITNQGGFDTGMVISNTSMDPWGDNEQHGACTIYYYGFTTGGGAAPAPVDTPEVPAGQHAIWTLSSGGTVQTAGGSIAAVPGFQGYAIAICQFQYAHGYAFISDIGASKLAQGYLALILDAPADSLPRSGSQSEPLNQ